MKKEIRLLNISDIHLGESKTTSKHTYESIKNYLGIKFKDITHLVVSGDFTHKQLSVSSEDYKYAKLSFIYIVAYCKKHGIKLRFLEGTPSHDYRQVETLSLMVTDIDYKYFKDISIEYDSEYGVNILYVPDEMGVDRLVVLEKIRELMLTYNLTGVDIAIMHGSFKFHMPGRLSFEIEDFDFVKYFIIIGHNHTSSIVGKINTPGSFERNSFGEEEKKGGLLITLNPITGIPKVEFKENVLANKLDTINILSTNTNDALLELNKKLNKYKGLYLRLDLTNSTNVDFSILRVESKKLGVDLFNKKIKENEEVITAELSKNLMVETIQITPNNIEELLMLELKSDKYKKIISEIK